MMACTEHQCDSDDAHCSQLLWRPSVVAEILGTQL